MININLAGGVATLLSAAMQANAAPSNSPSVFADSQADHNNDYSAGEIVGIVIGFTVAAICLIGCGCVIWDKKTERAMGNLYGGFDRLMQGERGDAREDDDERASCGMDSP